MLGAATAIRFYFVTWLGERVIADIRKAVFDNVIGLTPAFFEVTRTGEVLSRLTADTTLIQTVVGSSASVAARNLVMLTGALAPDVRHQREADAAGDRRGGAGAGAADPVRPLGASFRRTSQDRIADTSARASETLNAVQTVQAFTHEAQRAPRFRRRGGKLLRRRDPAHPRARGDDGGGHLRRSSPRSAGVLWVGAQDVVAHRMTGGDADAVHHLAASWRAASAR